jgi:hypothetical protein
VAEEKQPKNKPSENKKKPPKGVPLKGNPLNRARGYGGEREREREREFVIVIISFIPITSAKILYLQFLHPQKPAKNRIFVKLNNNNSPFSPLNLFLQLSQLV